MFHLVLTLTITAVTLQAADKIEWTPLFDGKSIKGWEPRAKVESFKAVNGELHLTSNVNVWVVSDLQLGDFVAELEVKFHRKILGSIPVWVFDSLVIRVSPKVTNAKLTAANPVAFTESAWADGYTQKVKSKPNHTTKRLRTSLSLKNGIISK